MFWKYRRGAALTTDQVSRRWQPDVQHSIVCLGDGKPKRPQNPQHQLDDSWIPTEANRTQGNIDKLRTPFIGRAQGPGDWLSKFPVQEVVFLAGTSIFGGGTSSTRAGGAAPGHPIPPKACRAPAPPPRPLASSAASIARKKFRFRQNGVPFGLRISQSPFIRLPS